jgi:hypothetical protein
MLRELAGNEAISGHALHSLVVLWEDALCTVDTTPRSVNSLMLLNDTAVAEAGQVRVRSSPSPCYHVNNYSNVATVCVRGSCP